MPLTRDQRYGLIALGAIGVGGLLADRYLGVRITGVTYENGPGPNQRTAKITVHNYTDSNQNYTLAGYMATAADVQKFAPAPLGIHALASPVTRYNKLYQQGAIKGHWFKLPNVVSLHGGAVNSQQANAERAIPFSLPRGHQLIVTAYTANYLLPVALYDIWFVFAGSGASVLGGKPVASWFDPQALSPIKTS